MTVLTIAAGVFVGGAVLFAAFIFLMVLCGATEV
jgi:hypothetical protein